jgi:hypothetical protein
VTGVCSVDAACLLSLCRHWFTESITLERIQPSLVKNRVWLIPDWTAHMHEPWGKQSCQPRVLIPADESLRNNILNRRSWKVEVPCIELHEHRDWALRTSRLSFTNIEVALFLALLKEMCFARQIFRCMVKMEVGSSDVAISVHWTRRCHDPERLSIDL